MFRPDPELASDSNDHACFTKGVRVLPKPQLIDVGLPPAFDGCRLNVVYHDGVSKGLRISKRVAEVLIAQGFAAEG